MESLGSKLRKQRLRLGLTLDDLSARVSISKPYLSLIETGRVANPPSDEKLRRLEQTLGFPAGELLTHAHLHRTPRDVRAVLGKLLSQKNSDEPAALTGVLREFADGTAFPSQRLASTPVPVINRHAADYPADFSDLAYPTRVADEYIAIPEILGKDAFAARVHGDAMAAKYRDGDLVIFAPSLPPRDGDDCFVRFASGQTTFKRIFFESDGQTPVVRLQPRNEKYRAMVVKAEELSGLYRAAYRYHRVDED
jgi:transcriptional regulator with XRE-family HTH domain